VADGTLLWTVFPALLAAIAAFIPAPHLQRVAVVVMENKEAATVIAGAPWLRAAGERGARATRLNGETHPSLPNYLALLTGSTHGVRDDDTHRRVPGPSLVDQLEARGVSWRAYMEGLPRACADPSAVTFGRYAKKHNPFYFVAAVLDHPAVCRKVVPLTQLAGDERRGLPRFVWITPDLCNDMHDCSVETGDRWLAQTMPALLHALGPRGALIVTFDEGTSNERGGGRIATVVLGGAARPGAVDARLFDHRAILATVEDALGLGRLPTTRSSPALGSLLKR
jgi:hypothetical protein